LSGAQQQKRKAHIPPSDGVMVRALADPQVLFDVKEQLYELFAKRLWPQEFRDTEGRLWVYRPDAPPVQK
jgi:hypothetical protein